MRGLAFVRLGRRRRRCRSGSKRQPTRAISAGTGPGTVGWCDPDCCSGPTHSIASPTPTSTTVAKLGLACLIDFRHQREIELVGEDRLPDPAPRVVHLPLFDTDHDVFTAVGAVLKGQAGAEAIAHLRADAATGGAAVMMVDLYRRFVNQEASRAVFAEAVNVIATPGELPLLFHCTAGKDRTGWLAAVVLTALGVDRDTIVADYLRTHELNAVGRDFTMATMASRIDQPEILLPLLEVRHEYLEAAFFEADRCYGGMMDISARASG